MRDTFKIYILLRKASSLTTAVRWIGLLLSLFQLQIQIQKLQWQFSLIQTNPGPFFPKATLQLNMAPPPLRSTQIKIQKPFPPLSHSLPSSLPLSNVHTHFLSQSVSAFTFDSIPVYCRSCR